MRMLIVLTVLLGLAAPALAVESRSLSSSAAPGYLAGPQAPLVSSPTVGAPVVPVAAASSGPVALGRRQPG